MKKFIIIFGIILLLPIAFAVQIQDYVELVQQKALNYYMEVAKGNEQPTRSVNKFGRNTDVDSGATETIWDGDGLWAYPNSSQYHSISSTSSADTLLGNGARQIQIYGLTDWDTPEVNEVINMSGLVPVNTTRPYVVIYRMKVIEANQSVNVGTITARAQGDNIVTAQINPLEGQTQMAVYAIPRGQTFYMTKYYISLLRANAPNTATAIDACFTATIDADTNPNVWQVKHTIGLNSYGSNPWSYEFNPPNRFDGPVAIRMCATTTTSNLDISGGFDGVVD